MKSLGFSTLFLTGLIFFLSTMQLTWAEIDYASRINKAMESLQKKTKALGEPKIKGSENIGEKKQIPILYFGSTKINGDTKIVDSVKEDNGGTATIFVKNGSEYVRVSTNIQKDDGTRAVGTILDPKGKAYESINKGEEFTGVVSILGRDYHTQYVPIKNSNGTILGIYYVGYLKIN